MTYQRSILLGITLSMAGSVSAPVLAANYTYNRVVDLNDSMFRELDFIIEPEAGSITLNRGDTVSGEITFAKNGRVTLTDTGMDSNELLTFFFRRSNPQGSFVRAGNVSFSFLGLQGQVNQIASPTFGSGIGSLFVSDVSASSFSFIGFSYSVEYAVGMEQPFNLLKFNAQALRTSYTDSDLAVPEPATWAMLISGFGIVGAAARRKKSAGALHRLRSWRHSPDQQGLRRVACPFGGRADH